MSSKKTIFIIPGYRHRPTNKAYKEIAKILRKEGYYPIVVSIPWSKRTISENTEYFLKKYKKVNSRNKYISGFSLGAMIAFLTSTKANVKGLILCSLSPYFQEDLPKTPKNWDSPLQIERFEDFSKLHCGSLAKQIKTEQVLMLYGVREARQLIRRVNGAFNQMTAAQKFLLRIKETDHEIGNKKYLNTIHQAAKVLN